MIPPSPTTPALDTVLPPQTVRQHRIVPLHAEDGVLEIGLSTAPRPALLREVAFLTGMNVVTSEVSDDDIDQFIESCLPPLDESAERAEEDRDSRRQRAQHRAQIAGSVVRLVDELLKEAIDADASDIHLEPYERFFRVRFRLDGVLHTIRELPLLQRNAVISRLKIMASLDIAEKRRPQDGRIRFTYQDRAIDMRVSTLPTDFGEKVVLRILDKGRLSLNLNNLGFSGDTLETFRDAIRHPYGMILVSGPTGSGKTTTLYAALNELNEPTVNITTIEDPIEYNLPGINQTHLRSDIGLTFAHALRAFLRQDPDIIMLGEIRDQETAQIAIRAALTGHLVLSTIHTNDAPSTVTRLVDMGIEPYLVASCVRLVIAQRLVRRVCESCSETYAADPHALRRMGLSPGTRLQHGAGCEHCNQTGYSGRTALFEVLPINDSLAELISQKATPIRIRKMAVASGMRTLHQEGISKVVAGLSTMEEVMRETGLGEV